MYLIRLKIKLMRNEKNNWRWYLFLRIISQNVSYWSSLVWGVRGSRDKVKIESEQEISNYWGNWPGHTYTFDLVYLSKYLKTFRLKISGILATYNVWKVLHAVHRRDNCQICNFSPLNQYQNLVFISSIKL